MASTSSVSEALQSPVTNSVQKKILQDVLESIVQLKSDFFESQQPITDDSLVLQRFCAKLEHLIQIGMKEKTSLLGRKKDYWDYFCECLASSKGSNDGIKYVKSLAENKMSLGRGRAFIRFCLVHQRLADTLQQCVAHAKTKEWFMASSVFLSQADCSKLINSLYDLNSLHFDLSPRGYDLDAAWPSFANRKLGPVGTWNIPISRRSSITSMDTVSQISVSVDNTEVDRLTKDLEVAQNAKGDLIGRIDALQQEKEQVSQSAWETHGELQAQQQQLRHLQSQHASLQERYKELEINHMRLKLEKEHGEKFMKDEIKILNEKFKEEESKRVSQLKSEEEIWKKEVREEGDRRKREIDRLQKELNVKVREAEERMERAAEQRQALKNLLTEFNVMCDSEHFEDALAKLAHHIKALHQELTDVSSERKHNQTLFEEEQLEKNKRLSHLEGQLLELELALKESHENQGSLSNSVAVFESQLKTERDSSDSLRNKESLQESTLKDQENVLKKMQEEVISAEKKNNELEERNNEMIKKKDELFYRLEEVERQNVDLKYELEKRDADLELCRRDKDETEQRIKELSQVTESHISQLKGKEEELHSLKEQCGRKMEEVLVLKQSSEGQATDLEKLLQKKDEALTKMKSELEEAEKKLELVRKDVENVENENKKLTNELSMSEAETNSLKHQYTDIVEKVKGLEAGQEERKLEVHERDIVIIEEEAEIEKLKDERASLTENLESAISQAGKLQASQLNSETEKDALRAEIKMLLAEKESLKSCMDVEKSRIMRLLQESEGVKRSDGEKDEKIASLLVETEKLRFEKDEMIAGLEKQIKSGISDVTALNSEVEILKTKLNNEKLSSAEIIENKENEFQKLNSMKNELEFRLKNVIARLEAERQEVKQIHENETASYSERIKNLESEVAEKEKVLATKCLDYEAIIEGLKKEHANLLKTSSEGVDFVNKLTSEVAALREERDHLQTQVNTALEDVKESKTQLIATLEHLALSKTQLETVTAEKNLLSSELKSMSEEQTRIQNEKEALEREINIMKDSLKAAEDDSQETLSQKRKVELEFEELKDKFNIVMAENLELGTHLESYQSQTHFSTKVLEENLVEAKDALDCMKIELMELQGKCQSVEKERDDLKERLEKSEEEKKDLRNQIDSWEKGDDNIDGSEVAKLKGDLREEQQKYLSTIESLNEEISALQFQLSAEKMVKHDTSQTREDNHETTNELKAQISDLEVIIEELEQKLETLHKTKDVESTQVKSTAMQVQELRNRLLTKQQECDQLQNQVQQINSKLVEETARREQIESDYALLRSSYDRDIEEKVLEINILKSDNEQIKKKLVKLIRDKDTLWHKTDELVTERKRIMEDRWQENDQVTHCFQCKTEFSLFVRKHHCRVCGRIFCWSCSDFWIDSPQSSKKIRACHPCFHHNSSLDTSSKYTSMIDAESDDEEDDDEVAEKRGEVQDDRLSSKADVLSSAHIHQAPGRAYHGDDPEISSLALEDPSGDDQMYGAVAGVARSGSSSEENTSDESPFQIIDQDAVMKSISAYSQPVPASAIPPNMTSSMLLSADDLKSGEVNRQNEVWIKPGKTFIVPVNIEQQNTVLLWEFTSQPKDIVFSVNYRANELTPLVEAEDIVSPCKCDSHRQTVHGELTAKQHGIYTLIFDNSYSKVMSKKVHYSLEYKK